VTQREKDTVPFEIFDSVPVYRLRGFGLPGIFSFGFFFSSLFFLISNSAKYDIIHVHLATSAALAAVFAAGISGKGCVVKFAGAGKTGDIGTSARKLCGGIKLYILKKSRAFFTAPSNEVASEMISAGFNKENVIKIPNGVDSSFFSPPALADKEKLKEEMGWQCKKVFLFAGRLEEPKDIAFFLNVWGEVSNEKALFVIAGSGYQERALKDIAEKKQIKNVIFAGKRSDMIRFYRASDYFVLPSHAEGLSNALLEAMSCALTVVASDIPANREIIDEGKDGFLFSFERQEELAKIIKRALLDKDDKGVVGRMGEAAREKIVRNYSISATAQNHVSKVYGRL